MNTPSATSDFPTIALQALLSSEALLFGVLGFLYTVYAMFSSQVTPENPRRPPIVRRIRTVSVFLAVLISVDAVVSILALFAAHPTGPANIVLAVALGLINLAIAAIACWWVFMVME